MEHITVSTKNYRKKVALAACEENGPLDDIDIKDKHFLLIVLTKGKMEFAVGDQRIAANAPAFLCFDELENPRLLSKTGAQYTCVYFHPTFLNINMTFEFLRSSQYDDIASVHDMFMLRPFMDKTYVIPISHISTERIAQSADYMRQELTEQRDRYWSCRGRTYFMELIIALERMYGLNGYGWQHRQSDNAPIIKNPRLRDAVLYIEENYRKDIALSDVAANARINHTDLNALMKGELGCTAMEYLKKYRIAMSKKQLAFTDVPIKDISDMVGFKTVQHFNRVFKEITGTTPAVFRRTAVEKRRTEIK